jgi:class 3 adenylate cyclase
MGHKRVERRLAAILATGIAGYSRLMGFDEENTLTALKTYWGDLIDPNLAEHRGRAGTDFRDAEAIAEAVQRPTMKFIATKTADQLDLTNLAA